MSKVINIFENKKDLNRGKIIGKVVNSQIPSIDFKNNEIKEICSSFGNIKEYKNRYIRNEEIISNFCINPVEQIIDDNMVLLKVELVTVEGRKYEKTINILDMSTANKFRSIISSSYLELYFKGKDDDMIEIKDIIINKGFKVKKGVKTVGIIKNNDRYIFVSTDKAVDENGEDIDDAVFAGDKDSIDTSILEKHPIWEPQLEELSKALFNFNELENTATILGYCASAFLKERLYEMNKTKFFHLLLCGEAGSGKSGTAEDIIMPIFSTSYSTSVAQCTKFVLTKVPSISTTIPFIIEEYKPTMQTKSNSDMISELMRSSYNRTPAFRGRLDGGLKKYPILSPIVLVGEISVKETAIVERSLMAYFKKSNTKDNKYTAAYEYLKQNKELLSCFGKSLLEEALKIKTEVLMERQRILTEIVGNKLPVRVMKSVVNCMLGIMLIQDVYNSMCFDIKQCTGYTVEELFDAIITGVEEYLLDGKAEVFGAIDKCIEILNDMVEGEVLKKGVHYQVFKGGTELALAVKEFYPEFKKYVKAHNMTDIEILPESDFLRQLRLKEYYVKCGERKDRTVTFNSGITSKKRRAYILDIEKLKEKIDVSNLCE